ncbi:sugar phosphate isomerase/epimerase [Clostridium sp. D33t1_170424_F3]|uniref:sugar phosphate isomerase/epimerase family protein n=1 Tax=Clostridium sp. D33t1_170424_F3 TaxID=2787099 RepID=UPI0018ABB082|nr:sugar phosphate isomerase/epimerase [Clostridium sp. D33t1_170424_F3]
MQVGISTACLYPMELEQSLSTLLSMDFRLFEVFLNTFSELSPVYLKELKKHADAYGARIKSVHPFTSGYEGFLLFSEYERRFRDSLEFYKQYFEAANLLGAEIVVLHGQRDYQYSKLTKETYFERYAALYALGKSYGVTLAQENVNQFRSETPAFISQMRSYLKDACAFVCDIKQAVRAGQDPYAVCAAMGERLIHVHINDNTPQSDCLLPGCGEMDYDRFRRLIADFGYRGDLIIEVYRSNFKNLQEVSMARSVVERLI